MNAPISLPTSFTEAVKQLNTRGWALIRNPEHTLDDFSNLMAHLCEQLTFDPARANTSTETQKVDAGTAAVGLHIENGNTPMPPDLVGFFSEQSAKKGSKTTVCDGVEVYRSLSYEWQNKLRQPMTVSRYLPENLWKKYVANTLGTADIEQIGLNELDLFISKLHGQSYSYVDDGGIHYTLAFNPVRDDNLARLPAFANALLGPSYNYETPIYRFHDGSLLTNEQIAELRAICEEFTHEIDWRDGDIALLDNKRMLHGRRKIEVPLSDRRLHIGMGLNINLLPEQE